MDWKEIRQEFETTDISLSDLAVKHGLKYNTVKSRSKREKWKKGAPKIAPDYAPLDAPKKVQGAPSSKEKKRESKIKEVVSNLEIKVNEGPELTDKQRLFVSEYLIDLNATQAAIRAGYSAKTANRIGPELLVKTCIQKSIQEAKDERLQRTKITQDRVLQEYAKIGLVDIKDFLKFRTGKTVVGYDKETGEPIVDYAQIIEMNDSDQVDGTMIQEVSISPKGIFSFKLHDKIKALDALSKHTGLFVDKHKQGIEDEKLKLDQAKFEMDKAKATGSTGIDANNERILTLAKLVNNPVLNRNAEDFEEDDTNTDTDSPIGGDPPNG